MSTTQLTDNTYRDIFPQVSGDNVVWYGNDIPADDEIFLYDGVTTTQVTDNSVHDSEVQIAGDNVVWAAIGSGSSDIFLYDGETTNQISNLSESAPQISGNNVVWLAHDGSDFEIFIATQLPPEPSNASFATGSDVDALNIDFGTVPLDDATAPIGFQIANLLSAGTTAPLDLVSIVGLGDTGELTTDLSLFADLAGGAFLDFEAVLDTSAPGTVDATYELSFTDVLGTDQTLTLNLSGEVVLPANDPSIPDLIYDAATGEVILDPDASSIIGYVLKNTTNSFLSAGHTPILGGVATSLSSEISEASFGGPALPTSIGLVFPTGMDITQLFNFLSTNEVSRSFGAPLVPFDLVVLGPAVPEPSTYAMATLGLFALGLYGWRRRRPRYAIKSQ